MFDAYGHIDAYLKNELNEEASLLFEKRMLEDKNLRNIVNEEKVYSPLADIMIQDMIQDNIDSARKKIEHRRCWKYALALLIFLLTVVICLHSLKKERSADVHIALFEKYYSPPMGSIARGDEQFRHSDRSCDRAHELLDSQSFKQAEELFRSSMTDRNCKEKSEFYLALILLREGNVVEAETHLSLIATNPSHDFIDKTRSLLRELTGK